MIICIKKLPIQRSFHGENIYSLIINFNLHEQHQIYLFYDGLFLPILNILGLIFKANNL